MKRPFDKNDSDQWVEASGFVTRLLHDAFADDERHQRFIVNVGHGQTILVAHNVELAGRVPIGIGDRIRLRGLYEWSELGGTVHWTHRDPMQSDEGPGSGGYIEFRRQTYR